MPNLCIKPYLHWHLDSLILSIEKHGAVLNYSDKNVVLSFLEEQTDFVYPKNSLFCVKFEVMTTFLMKEHDALSLSHKHTHTVMINCQMDLLLNLKH